jgi:hypothetical protein
MTNRKVKIIKVTGAFTRLGNAICTVQYLDNGKYNSAFCIDKRVKKGEQWFEEYTSTGWSVLKRRVELPDVVFSFVSTVSYYEIIGDKNIIFEFVDTPGNYYTNPIRTRCTDMNTDSSFLFNVDVTRKVNVWKLNDNF